MKGSSQPSTGQIGFILLVGILAVSTSAVLVRLAVAAASPAGVTATEQAKVGFSLVLAASRLALAAIALFPVWRTVARHPPTPAALGYACVSGLVLTIHFAAWITSLSYTSIVASTTLVTTNPVWVAIFSWLWLGEKPKPLTFLGIGIALLGGGLISLGGNQADSVTANPLLGNLLALVGSWAVSLYFLLGREAQRQGLSLSSYMAIAYGVAAIVLLPLPLLFHTPYTGYSVETYGYILLIAILPQLIGHTTLNWAVRWISPTIVALVILFEPVAASLLGYILFQELPGVTVLLGAVVILAGVAVATRT